MISVKKILTAILTAAMVFSMAACGSSGPEPTLYVEKCDTLSRDFIMGADVSSLISLEDSGVVFHGFDGAEQDMLKTLSEAGVNYIRVRVWNDPFDADGHGYGGGNCDINTAIALGKRAAQYGMGLLVDFHYSDFWADPSKQQAPKAWEDMDMEEKTTAIYDYTVQSLQALEQAGVKVGMVQIGNETTNGFCGEISVPRIMQLMASASQAVRDTAPGTLIAVHYTNPEAGKFSLYASNLQINGVDYDVFATSYYPYWHGTLENLQEQLGTVAEKYGKKVMVAETSWAYSVEDFDLHGNTIGEEPSYEKPYPFTVQGQAREIADVISAVASLGEAGIGVFYWEPAWIPVPGDNREEKAEKWEQFGSGWASSCSADYDPDDAGVYYGGSACDNQALFDAEGYPLESLRVFRYVKTGTQVPVAVDCAESAYVTVKLNNPIPLPETVSAIYNDGSSAEVAVQWDSENDLEAISASPAGIYPVNGTAEGLPVVCYVNMVEENYIENYSFEDEDCSMWQIENIAAGEQTDFQVKATDAFSGETSLHFWNADAVEFRVEQQVSGLRDGSYTFSLQAQGGDVGDNAVMYIYASADGEYFEQSFSLSGWRVWQQPKIENIPCHSGSMTVGVYIKAAGGGWGTLDDFLLNPIQ